MCMELSLSEFILFYFVILFMITITTRKNNNNDINNNIQKQWWSLLFCLFSVELTANQYQELKVLELFKLQLKMELFNCFCHFSF